MRLVLGYVLQRSVKWSIVLTVIAFLLLSLCQLLLSERVNFVNSLSHSLYFAAIYAGSLVIVQWREAMGDIILEGLGYPKWALTIPLALLSSALIISALCQIPKHGLSKNNEGELHWQTQTDNLTIRLKEIETKEQLNVFNRLMASAAEKERSAVVYVIALLFPLLLNYALFSWTVAGDYWLPLILTSTAFCGVEFWIRSFG